jgi:uncharacterized UPF0160 family protein
MSTLHTLSKSFCDNTDNKTETGYKHKYIPEMEILEKIGCDKFYDVKAHYSNVKSMFDYIREILPYTWILAVYDSTETGFINAHFNREIIVVYTDKTEDERYAEQYDYLLKQSQ